MAGNRKLFSEFLLTNTAPRRERPIENGGAYALCNRISYGLALDLLHGVDFNNLISASQQTSTFEFRDTRNIRRLTGALKDGYPL